jgi:hypothetical protein
VLDEASLIPDDVILGAARPIIGSEANGRFVMVSSALRTSGAFYDAVIRGQGHSDFVRSFVWKLDDADWISPSERAAARESLGEARYAPEYLGQFSSGADALLGRELVERASTDHAVSDSLDGAGPAKFLCGFHPASSSGSDRNAVGRHWAVRR